MKFTVKDTVIEARDALRAIQQIKGEEHEIGIVSGDHRKRKFCFLGEQWHEVTGQLESVYCLVLVPIISNGVDCVLARNNRGTAFHDGRAIPFGGIDGAADYYGCSYGRHVEVEIKTLIGVQQANQKVYQKLIEKHGGIYRVIRSCEEAYAFVEWLRATGKKT